MNLLLASADHNPLEHAVPHRLHEHPIFSYDTGWGDIPALFIEDGRYEFYITNHLFMGALSGILVLLVFFHLAGRLRPTGRTDLEAYKTRGTLAQLFETMCAFVRDEIARPNLGELTDKYIHYIWTVFFFVLFTNVLGLIPFGTFLEPLTGNSHWGGSATGNLSLNAMLAISSFVAIVYIGIKETGLKTFLAHFNPLGWDDPKMLVIGIPLYILEWMGLMIKCVVLAMRLFGTMMSGHLVLAAVINLIFAAAAYSVSLGYMVEFAVIIGGIMLTLLELFICCLQAFIFTFLTVLFISMVATHHDHDHDDDHDPFTDEGQMDVDKLIDPARLGPMMN